jgi:hypothetical protein
VLIPQRFSADRKAPAWTSRGFLLCPVNHARTGLVIALDPRTKKEQCSLYVLENEGETTMLRIFVEEAAALTSITLFVGMIAVWAQLISQF